MAANFWSGHPSTEISEGLAEIGRAAHERRAIDPRAFRQIENAAVKSPLSPEPFLVRGVEAQVHGEMEAAKRAFAAAQRRDPRSMPAAYFLAESYLRAGRPLKGLQQIGLLARLSRSDAAVPFVAAYARDPVNWPQMRALFRSEEGLEDDVLSFLARDARNADAILALADAQHRTAGSKWLRLLLSSLVARREYVRARALWESVSGKAGEGLLVDPRFSVPGPPPPFNWSFSSSTIGLAERGAAGLHVIFYGGEDGTLASQLLLLDPGTYRLQMKLDGSETHPEQLSWSIRCDKMAAPSESRGIGDIARRGWAFEIPTSCPAQWLELSGRSAEIPRQSEAVISSLALTRQAER